MVSSWRVRRGLLHLAFALLVTLLFLAAVEGVVRLFVSEGTAGRGRGDPIFPKQIRIREENREEVLAAMREENAGEHALELDIGCEAFRGCGYGFLDPMPLPAGKERWFVMGSSAAHGWAMPRESEIASLLAAALPHAEVINAGYAAHRSYHVLQRALKVIDYHEPTGLIVYTGNNEFIEWYYPKTPRVLGIDATPAIPLLERSRAYKSLAWLYRYWHRKRVEKPAEGRFYARRSLLDDGFCAKYLYEPDPALTRSGWEEDQRQILGQHRRNLEALVQEARRAGVHVILCTVPINPNLSPCHFLPQPASLDPERREPIAALLREGWSHLAADRPGDALPVFQRAVALDPTSALALYGEGVSRIRTGDVPGGADLLLRAREHTVGYLSGLVTMNQNIRDLARQEGVPLADLAQAFQDAYLASPDPLHWRLMSDYCHPTEEGNRVIVRVLLPLIRERIPFP